MSNTVCLITGANGFLGSEIVQQAIAANLSVRTTDISPESLIPHVDYHPADILDLSSFNFVFRGALQVIHAAGLAHIFDKKKAATAPFKAINEQGMANVTRAAVEAGVLHFVLISSVSVYGPFTQGVYNENAPCYPEGPYAESKYQAEQHAIEIVKQTRMALTILRLATLYGEGDPGNVARLMRTIDRGHFIWIGNGSNRKSLLHHEDAACACLALIKRPASGVNVYNVSGPPCTMREIVEGLGGALGKRIPPFGIPVQLVRGMSGLLSVMPVSRLQTLGLMAQKWLADDVYDGSKFAQTFNFQPRVSLMEGLRREVAWYRAEQSKLGA